MKVVFSPRARRRATLVEAWWREHRPAAPDLFVRELAIAMEKLAEQPHIGSLYSTASGSVIRRLLLPSTEQHIYYAVNADAHLVILHTVWGARRRRGPKL